MTASPDHENDDEFMAYCAGTAFLPLRAPIGLASVVPAQAGILSFSDLPATNPGKQAATG